MSKSIIISLTLSDCPYRALTSFLPSHPLKPGYIMVHPLPRCTFPYTWSGCAPSSATSESSHPYCKRLDYEQVPPSHSLCRRERGTTSVAWCTWGRADFREPHPWKMMPVVWTGLSWQHWWLTPGGRENWTMNHVGLFTVIGIYYETKGECPTGRCFKKVNSKHWKKANKLSHKK